MAAPVPLRSDFDAEGLRSLAKGSRDPAQTRRLLALSAIYAGGSRTPAGALGGVGLQTVRDWVVAFDAQGPDGLIGGKAPGARPRLSVDQRAVLRALVEQGPMPAGHGVVRWRLVDLAQILFADHGVFTSYADILDHCCDAWNTRIDRPWRIMPIGLRPWAHGF